MEEEEEWGGGVVVADIGEGICRGDGAAPRGLGAVGYGKFNGEGMEEDGVPRKEPPKLSAEGVVAASKPPNAILPSLGLGGAGYGRSWTSWLFSWSSKGLKSK